MFSRTAPTQQQRQKKMRQQQQSRRVQSQGSRNYVRKVVQMADEQQEPIKFTLKFKKFIGDLMSAGATLATGSSRAKSRIIFTVGGPDGMPAILEGRLVTRPYSDKQLPLAVSSDDTTDRRLIEFTIRPMNSRQMQQFKNKRQQKRTGVTMQKLIRNPFSALMK